MKLLNAAKAKVYYVFSKNKLAISLYKKIFYPNKYAVFYPSFVCNYHCPYCIINKVGYGKKYADYEHSGKEWTNAFSDFPPMVIGVSGGEPFRWSGMPDFLRYISKKHFLNITTNLSWNIDDFIDKLKSCPASFTICGSFHPYMTEIDTFKAKIQRLQDAGFRIFTDIVAYPPIISKLEKFKSIFEKSNIHCEIVSYVDPTHNYTPAEAKIIKDYVTIRNKCPLDFEKNPGLKSCSAGSDYFFFAPNGDVFICNAGFYYVTSPLHKNYRADKDEFCLGNLFDGSFKPMKSKKICKYPCSEICDLGFAKPKPLKSDQAY